MADYQIIFQRADTIASGSTLNPGDTQCKLTSGNFGTHKDYYVVDYDIPALAEVVELDVNGTTVNVLSRGRDGTSQQPHSQGAKIASMWTQSHQLRIHNAINALVPISQEAYATSDVVMANPDSVQRTVPGCSVSQTAAYPGSFVVSANCDFDVTPGNPSTIILVGQLLVDGVSARGQLVFAGSSPTAGQLQTRATVEKTWVIPAVVSVTPHTFVLQVSRISGSGATALVHQDHTGLIVTYSPSVVL